MLRSEKASDATSAWVISDEKPELFMRPFGWCVEDLEVNFEQACRPELETHILACCMHNREGKTPDRVFFWTLEIGKRTEYLLTLATLPNGSQINSNLRCSNSACQQQMEVVIPLLELTRLQQQSETPNTEIMIGNEHFSIRKPTGNDQVAWLEQQFPDETSATLAIVQTLLPDEQKSAFKQVCSQEEDWIQRFDRAMEASDPLVNFSLQVNCPYCETENLQDFDLGVWAIRQLYGVQQHLLATVHRLASYYHWSESEIFAIPPWRRLRYLALIEREGN